MTNTAILVASALLLFAYLLDIAGRRFRLPSVVLLIVTGLVARQVLDRMELHLRWVDPVVPIVGTLGLILIVLEGALDLSLRRDRARMIARSLGSAFAGFVACVAAFAMIFHFGLGLPVPSATLAAIPFSVISSAVAIPSAAGLDEHTREFVIYESAVSDIVGVLVFYAWLESNGSIAAFAGSLFGGGAISLVAAAAAAVGLLYLINRVDGHVRFLPLLAGLVFLYAIGKVLHLSPLIVILVCGLVINNPHLVHFHPKLRALHNDDYAQTLKEFKGLVAELTFATKSFFFLLLGYWTDVRTMLSVEAWLVATAGIALILATRWMILKGLRQSDVERLVWIAPRGLITVLLFLSADNSGKIDGFPFGAVMLIVLATAALTALAHRVAAQPARAEMPADAPLEAPAAPASDTAVPK